MRFAHLTKTSPRLGPFWLKSQPSVFSECLVFMTCKMLVFLYVVEAVETLRVVTPRESSVCCACACVICISGCFEASELDWRARVCASAISLTRSKSFWRHSPGLILDTRREGIWTVLSSWQALCRNFVAALHLAASCTTCAAGAAAQFVPEWNSVAGGTLWDWGLACEKP